MSGSSSSFASTVDLRLGPSVRGVQWLLVLHSVVIVMLLAVELAPAVRLGLLAGVAASWMWSRRHAAFGYGPRACVRLVLHPDETWSVYDAAGREQQASLSGDSIVQPFGMILRFNVDGRSLVRLLLGDEAPAEDLRRLRMRLGVAAA